MIFEIYRYQGDSESSPSYARYEVDIKDIRGIMLLDALEHIKVLDSSLAFRRSCGSGVCGSDGMNINGKNGLACMTRLSDLPNKVIIRPLPSMPVIKDLVVDLSGFYKQFESVQPYLNPKKSLGEKEHLVSIAEDEEISGLLDCILCACCTSMCPSYWWNPSRFVGPAGLLWACRFIMDSRDMSTEDRLESLDDLYRLYRCRSIMNCVAVCPKGLNPNEAISKIRTCMGERT